MRMDKTHDFIMSYRGFWQTGGRCRIRIYEEPGRVPVVICSQLPDSENTSVTNLAEYLAAEVVEEYLPDLPNMDPPLIWVQHYPPDTVPAAVGEMLNLVTFASYEPTMKRTNRPGLAQRIALGEASWEETSRRSVQSLIGQPL